MVKSDELLNALIEAVMASIKITIIFPTTKIRRNDSEQSKATDSGSNKEAGLQVS